MMLEKTNPALRAAATGLGNVVTGQVIDSRETTAPTHFLQQQFIARRTRLRPDLARIVASLVFDGGNRC